MERQTDELVFLSVFNYGAIELAKNHLFSLRKNNINNSLCYVTDHESEIELNQLGYRTVYFEKKEDDEINKDPFNFNTKSFNQMSYLRYKIIASLLREGKTVWYLDVDTVINHDLNQYYEEELKNKSWDILFQHDINMLCTGCMLFRPHVQNINFVEGVYHKKNQQQNDQLIVNEILPYFGLKVEPLSIFLFTNGLLYFLDLHNNSYFRKAQEQYLLYKRNGGKTFFIHANYMIGNEVKKQAFIKKGLWFL